MLQELSNQQAELMNRYIELMQAKEKLLERFGDIKDDLAKAAKNSIPAQNKIEDAIIDLPDALRNYDLEREMARIAKYISTILWGLSDDNAL